MAYHARRKASRTPPPECRSYSRSRLSSGSLQRDCGDIKKQKSYARIAGPFLVAVLQAKSLSRTSVKECATLGAPEGRKFVEISGGLSAALSATAPRHQGASCSS